MESALIERAIESAKARKYKLNSDQSGSITDGHFKKIEKQKEVMEVTVKALERLRNQNIKGKTLKNKIECCLLWYKDVGRDKEEAVELLKECYEIICRMDDDLK
jgi:hypothetical protein